MMRLELRESPSVTPLAHVPGQLNKRGDFSFDERLTISPSADIKIADGRENQNDPQEHSEVRSCSPDQRRCGSRRCVQDRRHDHLPRNEQG